ncbi:Rv3235 family protein [Kibdelosporangium philippinense]|uniref:Rv3235 family protein n=1 Tax=Kibdelosporangium philippinense TaxID=211113 RepID=A0ABS8ZJT8_9PSEU|nr:Rv3235 family protein [Kibdelosporangium philippinense]MCE7006087.1 Rv3235 family protein [Kibdelosporangium philippinense]
MITPTLRPLHTYEPVHGQILKPARRPPAQPPVVEPLVTPDNAQFMPTVTKILEVLDGRRPLGQLTALVAEPVYQATVTRLRTTPPVGIRYQLSSMHSCQPSAGVVEACGVVEIARHGVRERRAQALACRFEFREERWWCVYFRILVSR